MGEMSNDFAQMNWERFGFPSPGFMPANRPAEALLKALAERGLPFAEAWDFETIAETDFLECLAETGKGQVWCVSFDDSLKRLAPKYLNHLHADFEDLKTLADVPMWTWDELLLEAADGDGMNIADPRKGDLSAEWSLVWLLQRKRAVDLLLYAPVPHKYDRLSGSVHNGIPLSAREAIETVLDRLINGTGDGLPSTYVNNIYGPDHGWREGSYCCNIVITEKIYADLPEGFNPEGNVLLVMKVAGAGDEDGTFAGGAGLSLGINLLKADQDGVFITFPDFDFAYGVPTPTRDHQTRMGWKATTCKAFADYTGLFYFKGGQ